MTDSQNCQMSSFNIVMKVELRHISMSSPKKQWVGQTGLPIRTGFGARGMSRWPSSSSSHIGFTPTMFRTVPCWLPALKQWTLWMLAWKIYIAKISGSVRRLLVQWAKKAFAAWNCIRALQDTPTMQVKPNSPLCQKATWCTTCSMSLHNRAYGFSILCAFLFRFLRITLVVRAVWHDVLHLLRWSKEYWKEAYRSDGSIGRKWGSSKDEGDEGGKKWKRAGWRAVCLDWECIDHIDFQDYQHSCTSKIHMVSHGDITTSL